MNDWHTYLLSLRWIEACIDEELPATTELEENLQNGVILAKLGHFFAPKVVPLKRIYDKDLNRYKVRLLQQFVVYSTVIFGKKTCNFWQ